MTTRYPPIERHPSRTSVHTVSSRGPRRAISAFRHDESRKHPLLPHITAWVRKAPRLRSTQLVLDELQRSLSKLSLRKSKRRLHRHLRTAHEPVVPSAEVILDNSNADFKLEILRLTHTLQIPGWRRLRDSHSIDIVRLSGALTNAVYVVTPPSSSPARKLLLRIYGPQVEFLIDREQELEILRRLARKSLGPQLLGTFTNGRFEQYFDARTLTAADLRVPSTSVQIAKRMRELHDGIELSDHERIAGPSVWRNWDKWAPCAGPQVHQFCGSFFYQTVEKYRAWLAQKYPTPDLVFAHNDTQYGNVLRLQPSGESPLLLPANEHKQLVVIDFEYASANVPALEFANHFTEWCYNYHDSQHPHALHASRYPSVQEQRTFLRAYVQHHRPTGFTLDSRSTKNAEEEAAVEREIQRLLMEIRCWRAANSAQWVVWGIIQGKQASPPEVKHFDYLSYAQDRALLFWGDMLQLGLVEEQELAPELVQAVKYVP